MYSSNIGSMSCAALSSMSGSSQRVTGSSKKPAATVAATALLSAVRARRIVVPDARRRCRRRCR